jgi:hypothetical protein
MGIGHEAVGLGLKCVGRRINAGAAAASGLWIYRSAARRGSRGWAGMAVYLAALSVFLIAGQAGATGAAPPRSGLIASWLAALPVMCATAGWLDRRQPAAVKASA